MENVIYFGKNNRPKNIPVFHTYLSIYLYHLFPGFQKQRKKCFYISVYPEIDT